MTIVVLILLIIQSNNSISKGKSTNHKYKDGSVMIGIDPN